MITPDSLAGVSGAGRASAQAAGLNVESQATESQTTESQTASGTIDTDAEQSIPSLVRLVLSLEKRSLEVSTPEATIRYDVAIGQDDWQTPTGDFTVMSKLENPAWQHPITKEEIPPGPDNPLGDRWIGFWSDGEAQIGFHGTNQEDLIGEAVSHGCVRMRNEDVKALYALVEVGTPVEIVP
ncbi:MAG: L,D-transpeptidase [Phormidesmis sp.]